MLWKAGSQSRSEELIFIIIYAKILTMNQLIKDKLDAIKELKKKVDALRPLSPSEATQLKRWYEVTYTFHSNSIEGNSLTLAETKIVVEDGLTVGGKPLRDVLEAKNHKELVDDLIEVVQKKKTSPKN